jgi:predicted DNA-binding transcriptional regulator AlpA
MNKTANLLSTDEAARLLGRSIDTLRYWRYAGRGPVSFRLGRRVVYDRSAVLAWIEKERQATSSGDDVA